MWGTIVGDGPAPPNLRHDGAVKRAVIVASCESYRTGDFLTAASALRVETLVATDAPAPIEGSRQVLVDLDRPAEAAAVIAGASPGADAVLAIDDQGVMTATMASEQLGLAHNPPGAAAATRDKLVMRRTLAGAGIAQPAFRAAGRGEVPDAATDLGYPVVVKPVGLAASRGVIRVNGAVDAAPAEARIRAILETAGRDPAEALLVEEYVPGDEIAVEGLLVAGAFETLAVIDKPDPLVGPFFEETLFTTPSRHPAAAQDEAVRLATEAAAALGLRHGPVHAEVRMPPGREARLVEIAARPIGGLCGRALTFGLLGETLEVMILRSALGVPPPDASPARPASGALMLPIPATGTLTDVEGIEEAKTIDGVDDVAVTIALGRPVVALPEGDRYLGFVFASGATADDVERTLREAANVLTVAIDGEYIRPPVSPPGPE